MSAFSMLLESEFDFELALLPASDEDERSEEVQVALIEADKKFRALDVDLATGTSFGKAAGVGNWLNGDFVVHAAEAVLFARYVAKPFVPILAEWIKGQAGRKVRLRRGDVEVEAGTIEAAERAWKIVTQDKRQDEQETS